MGVHLCQALFAVFSNFFVINNSAQMRAKRRGRFVIAAHSVKVHCPRQRASVPAGAGMIPKPQTRGRDAGAGRTADVQGAESSLVS